MVPGGGRRPGEDLQMKRTSTNPKNAAPATVKELVPQPEPPAKRHTSKIIMNVFGTRYELTHHMEARQIRNEPGKVIEMPTRPA